MKNNDTKLIYLISDLLLNVHKNNNAKNLHLINIVDLKFHLKNIGDSLF